MDNATSVNRAMSLEQEVDTLRTELTLADAQLLELTTDFHQRDIKSCELSVFQEFSGEIKIYSLLSVVEIYRQSGYESLRLRRLYWIVSSPIATSSCVGTSDLHQQGLGAHETNRRHNQD